jgi:hypothetical protein
VGWPFGSVIEVTTAPLQSQANVVASPPEVILWGKALLQVKLLYLVKLLLKSVALCSTPKGALDEYANERLTVLAGSAPATSLVGVRLAVPSSLVAMTDRVAQALPVWALRSGFPLAPAFRSVRAGRRE